MTMCMSACVHLCLCAWACVCVCVCVCASMYVDSRKEHSINNVRLISLMDTLSAMESYGKVESNYRLTVNFERVL